MLCLVGFIFYIVNRRVEALALECGHHNNHDWKEAKNIEINYPDTKETDCRHCCIVHNGYVPIGRWNCDAFHHRLLHNHIHYLRSPPALQ